MPAMEGTSLHLELLYEGFAERIKCHKSNLNLSKSAPLPNLGLHDWVEVYCRVGAT